MNERVLQVPWDQLHHAQDEIPWPAMEALAETVPDDHDLVEALFDAYNEAFAKSLESPKYMDLYVPAIFALAAPRLSSEQRREIGEFLVDKLVEAGREDADLNMEALVAACGSMGPVVIPAVLDAISQEPDSTGAWFHLWGLTALAADTDDPDLRDQAERACVALLERIDRGEVETDLGIWAGWTLAYLGRTEYADLLLRLSDKSARIAGGADYRAAAGLLRGRPDSQRPPEMWQLPVREWLTPQWEAVRDWFAQRDVEAVQDMEVAEGSVREPHRLVRLFMNSPWATGLPEELHNDAAFIVGRLLEYAETFEGTLPTELEERTLRNVLLDAFPRKLTADREFFAKVTPVTEAFLDWMGSEGFLPDAPALARKVREWADEIVANAMDPKHWGPAKSETMKAMQTGADAPEEDVLQGFLFEQVLRSLGEMPSAGAYEPPPEPATPIVEHMPRVGRNDPCPCGSGKKHKRCCGMAETT